MPYEFDSARPIYSQLGEVITRQIISGGFAPGQKLPGVRELAMQYGVNPNTVQRTMTELERQGLVYSERTAGRFVSQDEALIAQTRRNIAKSYAAAFLSQMNQLGITREEAQQLLKEMYEREETVQSN